MYVNDISIYMQEVLQEVGDAVIGNVTAHHDMPAIQHRESKNLKDVYSFAWNSKSRMLVKTLCSELLWFF